MRTDYYNNHRNADYFTDNTPSPASVPARPSKPQAHAATPQKIAPKAQPAHADTKHSAKVSMRSIMDDATKLAQKSEACVKQAWGDVEKTATHAWNHPKQDALKFAGDVKQLDIGEAKEAWNVGIHTLDFITGGSTPDAWLPLSKPSNHAQAIGADIVDIATLALPVAAIGGAAAEAEAAGSVFEAAAVETSGETASQVGLFGRGAGGFTRSLGSEAVESSQMATRSEQLVVKDGLFGDGIGAEKVLTPTFSEDYGVALFGKDNIRYYVPDKIGGTPNLGAKGRPFFIMPGSDAAKIDSVVRAATETGFSPSTFNAWKEGGDIYGIAVPTKGLEIRVPTKADAMGWRHFLEGGHTAINAEGTNSFIVNTTREFVITGGKPMPEGSVFFRLDDNGGWAPIWRY